MTRGGMAWLCSLIYSPRSPATYWTVVAAMAISGGLAFLLLLVLSRGAIWLVSRVDYRRISAATLVLLLGWLSSRQPEFRLQYPLFISRLDSFPLRGQNITVFILYQFTYIFYYVGWEFFFRGFALFGLRDSLGTAGVLIFQAVISTALHAAKPMPETPYNWRRWWANTSTERDIDSVQLNFWGANMYWGGRLDLFILLRSG